MSPAVVNHTISRSFTTISCSAPHTQTTYMTWRGITLAFLVDVMGTSIFYATADEADAYMFYRCFFLFFFCFFPFATKYQTTVLGNGWTDFHETFTKRQRAQCNFQRRTEMGARPPINFLGAKNYALRTWWWRLASDWELECWLWHCAATAVTLKRHERVNAFNLVRIWFIDFIFSSFRNGMGL